MTCAKTGSVDAVVRLIEFGAAVNAKEPSQNQTALMWAAAQRHPETVKALVDAHADLKANTNFLDLQRQLADTEDKIQAARRFYNGNVRDLNTAAQSFPGNIIAGSFGFQQMEFFQLEEGSNEREPVKVKF